MKLTILASLILSLILFQRCEFEASTSGFGKKEPIPKSSVMKKGLDSDPAVMTVNGEPSAVNSFEYGSMVEFSFNNVTGLREVNGRVYPGTSLEVKDGNDSTWYQVDDLFADLNGTDLKPLQIHANFKVQLPYLNEEQYTVELKIWDRNSSKSMTFSMPFVVRENELLSVETNELDYTCVFFWDETAQEMVFNNTLDMTHEYVLVTEGVDGLDISDEKVFPGISLHLTDKNGNEILSDDNLVREKSETGIAPIELKDNQVPVILTFTPGRMANPCHLTTEIYDLKNFEKRITIEANLILN